MNKVMYVFALDIHASIMLGVYMRKVNILTYTFKLYIHPAAVLFSLTWPCSCRWSDLWHKQTLHSGLLSDFAADWTSMQSCCPWQSKWYLWFWCCKQTRHNSVVDQKWPTLPMTDSAMGISLSLVHSFLNCACTLHTSFYGKVSLVELQQSVWKLSLELYTIILHYTCHTFDLAQYMFTDTHDVN